MACMIELFRVKTAAMIHRQATFTSLLSKRSWSRRKWQSYVCFIVHTITCYV